MTATFMGLALAADTNGVFVVGSTKDLLYGGDMSGDAAGMGATGSAGRGGLLRGAAGAGTARRQWRT